MTTVDTAELTTARGRLRGVLRAGVRSFLGIPYALPPFGERRFAAPVPAAGWDGVRDAFEFGPTAPKPGYSGTVATLLPEPFVAGEDCLNLNVWSPEGASGLPVLVWIHGGAFVSGSSAVSLYDGHAFARDGVVCVTINYRMGVDGFGAIADAVPNRGLLDQIAALTWVRDNIEAFGGDPGSVTVAGESAGAMSVGTLLSMPLARGLFQRAVLQSGAAQHVLSSSTAAKVTAEIADRLGVPPTVQGLASVPVSALITMQEEVSMSIRTTPDPARWAEITVNAMPFEPVVDGDVVPVAPLEAIVAGASSHVDILIGTNSDESNLFFVPDGFDLVIDEPTLQTSTAALGVDADRAIATYRRARPGASPGQLMMAIGADWFYRIPAVRVAEARLATGADTFQYEFAWGSPRFDGRLGACHALEIGFTFDNLADPAGIPLAGDEPPQSLADEMHAAWVSFVRNGTPGWAPYGDGRNVQRFDVDTRLVPDPDPACREVWAGIR